MSSMLPTKGNLMASKRSRALAQTGYELMDRKRTILVRELMGLVKEATQLQSDMNTAFSEAYQALMRASMTIGVPESVAEAVSVDTTLDIQYHSVMGVELPRVSGQTPPPRMEYGFANTSSALDDCYLKFHRVKDAVRRMAEVETSVSRLSEAIQKTQKRANALSQIVIPDLDETIRLITDTLEEKEREEFVKLKVVKQMSQPG